MLTWILCFAACKDLSDISYHRMHTTTLWGKYSFLNIPQIRTRDRVELPKCLQLASSGTRIWIQLWLQNPNRKSVKIPWAFVLSALVLESTGAPLNDFGFSSFLSSSFLLQFSWQHLWEMTPIKTLWGQGWLIYHWPQILQDVVKLQFLNCLSSTSILSGTLRTFYCQDSGLVSLTGFGLHG